MDGLDEAGDIPRYDLYLDRDTPIWASRDAVAVLAELQAWEMVERE